MDNIECGVDPQRLEGSLSSDVTCQGQGVSRQGQWMREKEGPRNKKPSPCLPEELGEGYATGSRRRLLGHYLAGTLWEEESF